MCRAGTKEMMGTQLREQEEESRITPLSSSNLLDWLSCNRKPQPMVQSDSQFKPSALCLPKEIAWPSFCPVLSLVATQISVVIQQNWLFKILWLSFVSDKWPSSNPDFHSESPGEAYKYNLYQKANSKAQLSHQCLSTHRFLNKCNWRSVSSICAFRLV